jgi:hypothetical protein
MPNLRRAPVPDNSGLQDSLVSKYHRDPIQNRLWKKCWVGYSLTWEMVVISVLVRLVQCGCKGVLLPRPFSTQTQASQFGLTVATTTWFDARSKMGACPLDKEARFSLVRRAAPCDAYGSPPWEPGSWVVHPYVHCHKPFSFLLYSPINWVEAMASEGPKLSADLFIGYKEYKKATTTAYLDGLQQIVEPVWKLTKPRHWKVPGEPQGSLQEQNRSS